MKTKFLVLIILGIFLVSFVSSTCTVVLGETSYSPGETATAEIVCDSASEKSTIYTLDWTYQNGTVVESDTGTTPANPSEYFYEQYTIPSTWPAGIWINATLSGTGLEGTDSANVTGAAASSLIISGIKSGGTWLGLSGSVSGTIKDENGKKVSGGKCHISIQNNNKTQTLIQRETTFVDGHFSSEWILEYDQFSENTAYDTRINCYCGASGTQFECIDEDGTSVTNSVGSVEAPFTTNTWLTFNSDPFPLKYHNGTDLDNDTYIFYSGFEDVNWLRNVTNNYGSELKTMVTTYLVDTSTGKIYGGANEGSTSGPERTIGTGTTSKTFDHYIVEETPSGNYKIRLFFDVYYKEIHVANYIKYTETFNVSGQEDYFTLTDVFVKNGQKEIVNETIDPEYNISSNNKPTNYLEMEQNYELCINYTSTIPNSFNPVFYLDTVTFSENTYSKTWQSVCDTKECHLPSQRLPIKSGSNTLCDEDGKIPLNVFMITANDWIVSGNAYLGTSSKKFSRSENLIRYLSDEFWIDGVKFGEPWLKINNISIFENNASSGDLIHITLNRTSNLDIVAGHHKNVYLKGTGGINYIIPVVLDPEEQLRPGTNEYNLTFMIPDNCIDGEYDARILAKIDGTDFSTIRSISPNTINLTCSNDAEPLNKRQIDALEGSQAALEGIENKTGTFHLDIDCPSTGTIGSDMNCIVTAYVEDSQVVEKEVDFTCHISDGTNAYSSVNFNQMITRNPVSISRSFSIPTSFNSGQQYVLQCYADYYNLGSRRDSFYDSFIASSSDASGGGSTRDDGPGITGGAIDEEDEKTGDKPGLNPENFNPFSPERKWAFIFMELIIILTTLYLFFTLIKNKRKNHFAHNYPKSNRNKIIKKLTGGFFILLIISLMIIGIWQGYGIIKNSLQKESPIEQNTISEINETSYLLLKGNLIKSIFIIFIGILITSLILILFSTILLWLIFRLLNIRGEIKFGDTPLTRRYYEDKKSAKLQRKLNQIMLKNEIKRQTTKEDYKVRKMSQKEFADFINRKNKRL